MKLTILPLCVMVTLFLTINNLSTKCLFLPVGNVFNTSDFNYTIQASDTNINKSQFVKIQGWSSYKDSNEQNIFFSFVGKNGKDILESLSFEKNVNSDDEQSLKQFGLSAKGFQQAFGDNQNAKIYKIPEGVVLITLRFQVPVAKKQKRIGPWSLIVDLINLNQVTSLKQSIQEAIYKVQDKIKENNLTSKDVTRVLNIFPTIISSSIFRSFESFPARGTTNPIDYQAFIVIIREGQRVLAGPIFQGQPGVIQIKDKAENRTLACELEGDQL